MKRLVIYLTVILAMYIVTNTASAIDAPAVKSEINREVFYIGNFALKSAKLTSSLKKGILGVASEIPNGKHGVIIESFTNKAGSKKWTKKKRQKSQDLANKRAKAVAEGFLAIHPKINIVQVVGTIYDPMKAKKGERQVNELIAKIYILTPVSDAKGKAGLTHQVATLNQQFHASMQEFAASKTIVASVQSDLAEIKRGGIKVIVDNTEILKNEEENRRLYKRILIVAILLVGFLAIVLVLKGDSKSKPADAKEIVSAINEQFEELKEANSTEYIEVEYRGKKYKVPIMKISRDKYKSVLTYFDKSGKKHHFKGPWKSVKQETKRGFVRAEKKDSEIQDILENEKRESTWKNVKNFRDTIKALTDKGVIIEIEKGD